MRRLLLLGLLVLSAAPAHATLPESSTAEGTLGSIAMPPASPAEERSRALAAPITFHSKGVIKAVLLRFDRELKIRMEAVREGQTLKAVDTTVVDIVHGHKRFHGVLPVTARGTLSGASEEHLVNASNIWNITPEIREKLKAGSGPITVPGRVDLEGALKGVTLIHSLVSANPLKIETKTDSNDGDVHFTTVSTMAEDGLPLKADTTGTVKKGPLDVDVTIHLTRE